MPAVDDIRAVLIALALERGAESSFCPSEAARRLDSEFWRDLMPKVRGVAAEMQAEGVLEATRRGQVVQANAPGGPIRLQLRRRG
ncbi:DUF3253 domain-containing protein [Halovulum dunhuangense]|uniref:DUF3253 domain-containing protein n=1 Tax=Halovulum dunhuangense TaxID=1505036 RepID=A0A849L5C9_9RHOB|nr:DUF3253 domain-containing protein [Halovulum dunhuangense]NNU81566.1 DUF3253 domain-containing protein [Halovulum dunhuangense]